MKNLHEIPNNSTPEKPKKVRPKADWKKIALAMVPGLVVSLFGTQEAYAQQQTQGVNIEKEITVNVERIQDLERRVGEKLKQLKNSTNLGIGKGVLFTARSNLLNFNGVFSGFNDKGVDLKRLIIGEMKLNSNGSHENFTAVDFNLDGIPDLVVSDFSPKSANRSYVDTPYYYFNFGVEHDEADFRSDNFDEIFELGVVNQAKRATIDRFSQGPENTTACIILNPQKINCAEITGGVYSNNDSRLTLEGEDAATTILAIQRKFADILESFLAEKK